MRKHVNQVRINPPRNSAQVFRNSHYDIALSKKALAIEAGAIQITLRQAAAMNVRRRVTGSLGDPATALEWLSNYRAAAKAG